MPKRYWDGRKLGLGFFDNDYWVDAKDWSTIENKNRKK